MKKITLLFLAFITVLSVNAQLTLNGEYRPRTEFLHGYKAPMTLDGQMFTLVTTQRARFGVFYKSDKYRFGLQFQDVRAWGSTKQLVANDGSFTTVHQAWGEVLFNENMSLKLGRQELVYDDSRILGNVGWAQQARSHDIALLKYEKKGALKIHFGAAVNQVQTMPYNVAGNYKSMQFLWLHKKFGKSFSLSVLALNNGVADTVTNGLVGAPMTTLSQIIGVRPVYKAGKLQASLNFYYQIGDDKATYVNTSDNKNYHKNISAINLRIDVSYKATDNLKATVGFEMLSGNSETNTDQSYGETNHAFTPLYGTNHKFNGWMDYFYVGNHKNNVGLNDAYLQLDYKKDKILAGAHFHYFMANAEVLDQKEFASTGTIKAMSSGLGTEIDTYVGYKYAKGVTFKAGVSMMLDTETMRTIKGGSPDATNYWGWVMLVIKPTFLNK